MRIEPEEGERKVEESCKEEQRGGKERHVTEEGTRDERRRVEQRRTDESNDACNLHKWEICSQ